MIERTHTLVGADPELFVQRNGQIIGSERVIVDGQLSHIIRDGVQVELTPPAQVHVSDFEMELSKIFRTLAGHLSGTDVSISWVDVVDIDPRELEGLSPGARVLGCAPSKNIYLGDTVINVPATFRTRSAGGHVHLGITSALVRDERTDLVPMLDILLGNTAVLLDPGPAQAKRRLTYGRAGEYRLPAHGLEYRTLSNFWLRHRGLMTFVMKMAKFTVNILHSTLTQQIGYREALWEHIDFNKLQAAINGNNATLARENFEIIRPFLADYGDVTNDAPLHADNLDRFDKLVEAIAPRGLAGVFEEDPCEHWNKSSILNDPWAGILSAF